MFEAAVRQSVASLIQDNVQPILRDVAEKVQTISSSFTPPSVPPPEEWQKIVKSTIEECLRSTPQSAANIERPSQTHSRPMTSSRGGKKGGRGSDTNELYVRRHIIHSDICTNSN
jgi:hypothetical protein